MVHRKSTYKLSYKNISGNMRKSIWEENNLMRQRRRSAEMSHHSIEETHSECECDSEEEEVSESKEKSFYIKPKNISTHYYENNTKTSTLDSDEDCPLKDVSECPSRRISKIKEKKTFTSSSHNISPIASKRIITFEDTSCRSGLGREKRYSSDSNLNLLKENCLSRERRGVMKFTPLTGEFDLIPARLDLGNSKRVKEAENGNVKPSHSGFRYNRNILNLRPHSSVPFIHAEKEPRHIQRPLSQRRELTSVRKEPRVGSMKGNISVCDRCGERVKRRGILT